MSLLQQLKEKIPKKKQQLSDEEITNTPFSAQVQERYIGYNQALKEVEQSLPAMLEVVAKEVKKELLLRMMKYDSKDEYSILHDEIMEKVYKDVEDILSLLTNQK